MKPPSLEERRRIDAELREQLAEAVYNACCDPRLVVPWSEENESIKDHWRARADEITTEVGLPAFRAAASERETT